MVIIFIVLKILSKFKVLCDCSYSNCISCNSQYSCYYNNGVCSRKELIYNKEYIFFKLKECLLDSYSKSIIEKYCGNLEFKLNNKKLIIELPKINQNYGYEFLFCPFNIINSKGASNKFYIEFKKLNLLDLPFDLYLEINSNNLSYIMTPITDTKLLYEIKGSEKININYFSKYSYKNKPFKIIVSYKKNFFEVKIMIIIIIIIILIIIFFLCVILIIIYKRKELNGLIIFNNNYNNQLRQQQQFYIIEKNKKISEEFANNIQPVIYKNIKKYAKNNICNFCLNEFKLEDNVFISKCFHVFHFEEIKKWIFSKDICHNTCPECRKEFFKFFQTEDLIQVINQNNNFISNQNNNNNQNNNQQNTINNISQNNASSNINFIIHNQNNLPISNLNNNNNQLRLRENNV